MQEVRLLLGLVTTAFLLLVSSHVVFADEWDEAEKEILRLDPGVFVELPAKVATQIRELGCKIPQTYGLDKPHNVISGEFVKKGQRDWAVLCSRAGESAIRIFWGGSARCSSKIRESDDRSWLQGTGHGIGYSRAIATVGRNSFLVYHESFEGAEPPPLDHDGINDVFIEKASIVYYCHEGHWVELTGMD